MRFSTNGRPLAAVPGILYGSSISERHSFAVLQNCKTPSEKISFFPF